MRYLNLDNTDSTYIEYQLKDETTWYKLWSSKKKYIESKWRNQTIPLGKLLDRHEFKLRFSVGPTDGIDNYSGWNIDYLFFTGDSVPIDAAMGVFISPHNDCGLKSNEHIKVSVRNLGPLTLWNTPIKLSFDGGKTYVTETIPGPVLSGDTVIYTFAHVSDFSQASVYNIIVKVAHPRDNYPENDSLVKAVVSYPTYSLPYHTGFEQDPSYWYGAGINASWYQTRPSSYPAYEGEKCWKTDFSGYHLRYENSYVESPCFSFTGKTNPVIDVAFNYSTNTRVDGAILQYSVDKGKTWVYAREDSYSFNWNWYNDTVQTLKHKGWTGRSQDQAGHLVWKYGRQLLPAALANQDTVKFRFAFKSDSTTISPSEGFAFDDLTLQEAPFDVGVSSIDNVLATACQVEMPKYLQVHIKNYGVRTLAINDTMIVGVRVNRGITVIDTFKLSQAIPAGASIPVTLHKPVNLTPPGNDTVFIFTMIEKNPLFFDTVCNDTLSLPYFSKVNPVIGLPDSVYSARLDTMSLKPNCPGYTYAWKFEGVPSSACIKPAPLNPGMYYVTATSISNSCVTTDSIFVKTLIPNLGISQIVAPGNNCGYGTTFHPIIRIKNYGTDTIAISRQIPVKVRITGGSVVNLSESVTLLSKLAPHSTYDATLTSTLDLSVPGSYSIWACTVFPYDTTRSDDTTKSTFSIWGYPHVDLGPDKKVNAYKDTLYAAGANIGSYLWNDGSTNDSLIITTYGDYSVTVTDNAGHGCTDVDTVHMILTVHDIGIKRIVSPVNSCTLTNQTPVTFELQNFGTDTIRISDTITLSYQLNSGTPVQRTLMIPVLLPGDSMSYLFNQKADMHIPVDYNFQANVSMKNGPKNDLNATNNNITTVIHVYGNPPVSLGSSQIIQDKTEYPLDPGPGYTNYLWQDGSTNEVFTINQANARENGDYSVTVTDGHGCKASTSVVIYLEILDFEVTSVLSPLVPTCTNSHPVNVTVRVTNSGNQATDAAFPPIRVFYRINSNPEIGKQFVFAGNPGDYMDYTFSDLITLNNPETDTLKVRIDPPTDLRIANNSLTKILNVYQAVTLNLASGADTLVVNLPHTLDAGSGTGYTYKWSTNEVTQTIQAVDGNSKYYVTVTAPGGCEQTDSVFLRQSKFDLKISAFGLPDTMCGKSSQTISFDITNSGDQTFTMEPVVISFKLNNNAQVTKNVTFTGASGAVTTFNFDNPIDMSAAGDYNFTLGFACAKVADKSLIKTIKILKPAVNIGGGNDTLLTSLPYSLNAGAGNGYTYKWQDGSTAQTYNVHTPGWYKVTVTDHGCWSKDSVYVDKSTGITQLGDKAILTVFPNPANDLLYINLSLKAIDNVLLEIISSDGRLVKSLKLSGFTQYTEVIDVSSLPKGLYYIRIYHKDWVITKKEIIQ
jgi:hypothetical protein